MAESVDAAVTTLTQESPATRFVLQVAEEALPALSGAFGVDLPVAINRAAGDPGVRAALKLGPGEWLLIARGERADGVAEGLNAAAPGSPISLVEISDRQVGLALAGPGATLALNAGVPLDLSLDAFPVGMATRTIFEKAEIVLWRIAPDSFRIEVWRSFAPYVQALLEIAIRENAAEP